jgi:hypothetical protein
MFATQPCHAARDGGETIEFAEAAYIIGTVRFGLKADVATIPGYARFTSKSRHWLRVDESTPQPFDQRI